MRRERLLIIGGTGMLSKATTEFIANWKHTTIVYRRPESCTHFTANAHNAVELLQGDWQNPSPLVELLFHTGEWPL